jgi:uncharacterized protein (DUF697 family)
VKTRGISTAAAASALARELRATSLENRPLVVDGARELAALLRRELIRGGVAEAVREGGPLEGTAGVVYVLAGPAGPADVERLREASRAKIPAVCVIAAREGDSVPAPPYVLPEHIVRVEDGGSGSGFPIEAVTRAIAAALGQHATPLAARLPVLRDAVCEELIRHFSRQNAIIGVAVFVPGADLPVLTLNQVRLLLRISDAYGFELDRERIPEVLGVIGSAYGFRTLARSILGLVPVAGWAVKGGIAFVGTRALGEAARRYFEARAPVTRVPGDRAVFPR